MQYGVDLMRKIFYQAAATILGVKLDTIQQAIERGVLTKAGRQGRHALLIEEQVLLFSGINPHTGNKKRLSFEALTPEERIAWQRYADEVDIAGSKPVIPDLEKLVHEKVRQELAIQSLQLITDQKREADRRSRELAEREERFRKENPFPRERQAVLI
jgi:hypothetical protein